jgi:23S rRNA (guanosine2251-2'-O)-methyltransferase
VDLRQPRRCSEDGQKILQIISRRDLEELLPPGAVHQGVALETAPLGGADLGAITDIAPDNALVVLLDQASDPRNIGAVMRSAAAFGAAAMILPDRHTPEATGVLAKAASGALERLPLVRVTNIARTLAQLKDADFWCIGLDGDADSPLNTAARPGRVALVIGSEGRGLRRLTAEKCDALAAIPMRAEAGSLNLSAAAAIALYELRRTPDN